MLIIHVLMTDIYDVSYNQHCKSYVVYAHLVVAYIFVSLGHIGLLQMKKNTTINSRERKRNA